MGNLLNDKWFVRIKKSGRNAIRIIATSVEIARVRGSGYLRCEPKEVEAKLVNGHEGWK